MNEGPTKMSLVGFKFGNAAGLCFCSVAIIKHGENLVNHIRQDHICQHSIIDTGRSPLHNHE
jgi:hypothetical protein